MYRLSVRLKLADKGRWASAKVGTRGQASDARVRKLARRKEKRELLAFFKRKDPAVGKLLPAASEDFDSRKADGGAGPGERGNEQRSRRKEEGGSLEEQKKAADHDAANGFLNLSSAAKNLRREVLKQAWVRMHQAFGSYDVEKFDAAYTEHLMMGGRPFTKAYYAKIRMSFLPSSTKKEVVAFELERALEVFEEFSKLQLPHDRRIYNAIIQKCGEAERPDIARSMLDRMYSLQIRPNEFSFIGLMHSLCRVGELDAAYAALDEMLALNIKPTVLAFNVLLHGESMHGNCANAQKIMDEMMPVHEVKPNRVTFNTLIHVYSRGEDVEGMCNVWAAMKAAKCRPDGITRTAVMNAFRARGTLPTELWHELNELQDVATSALSLPSAPRDGASSADPLAPAGVSVAALQRNRTSHYEFNRLVIDDLASDDGAEGDIDSKLIQVPWDLEREGEGEGVFESLLAKTETPQDVEQRTIVMDLHGYSVMESLLLVSEQMEKVVSALQRNPERRIALDIITGMGNNSRNSRPVIRDTIMERLEKGGLSPQLQPKNPGIVNIHAEALSKYAHDMKRKEEKFNSLQLWLIRYTVIGSSIAAMFLIPYLWKAKEGH